MALQTQGDVVQRLLWIGKILALMLFLLFGAFFVEHMSEWFLGSAKELPPVWVWVAQGFQLFLLLGYLSVFKWPCFGSVLIVAAALAFFITIHVINLLLLFALSPALFILPSCIKSLKRRKDLLSF